MHVALMFPNQDLSAADLQERDVTVTICHIAREALRVEKGGTEDKWIVHFSEMQDRPKDQQKKLVLNKTNAMTIAKVYGNEADDWIGQKITLFPTTCQAFGKTVDCIRVRERTP